MMYCGKCGKPLQPTDKFCSECGTPLPVIGNNAPFAVRPVAVAPIQVKSPRKKNPTRMIFAILLLVLAVAGLLYSFTDSARIVGKWEEKVINVYRETTTYTYQFTVFGELNSSIRGAVNDDYSLSYSLKPHRKLSLSEEGTSNYINYSFQNGYNQLTVFDEDYEQVLVRKDFIPFYILAILVSVLMLIVGLSLMFWDISIKQSDDYDDEYEDDDEDDDLDELTEE